MKRFFVLTVLAMLVIAGCAGMKIREDDLTTEILVKATTAEYLNLHPGHADTVRRVLTAALEGIDAKRIINVDSLDAFVRAKANLDGLSMETQIAVDMLIKSVKKSLVDQLSRNGITVPADVMVQARVLLTWINETAAVYARNSR